MTSITILNSVITIGSSAFSGCTGLVYNDYQGGKYLGNSKNPYVVLIIGTATSGIHEDTKIIYSSAFFGCSGLTSITIPNGVTSIGDSAFGNCVGLTSVIWNAECCSGASIFTWDFLSVEYNFKYNIFGGCTKLATVTFGEKVKSIPYSAFAGCKNITSVIWNAENCTSAGTYILPVFSDCTKIATIAFGEKVRTIPSYVFSGCTSLTSLTIPNSVTTIDSSAFSGCTGLTSIQVASGNRTYHSDGNCLIETATKTLVFGCKNSIIPSDGSVTSIGSYAFYDCTGLTSITIPGSVTSIGSSAFSGCSRLASITYSGTKAQWQAISKGDSWNYNTNDITIHCTDGDVSG